MKKITRASMPDSITYNKKVYTLDSKKTHFWMNKAYLIDDYNCILVVVTNSRLKDKTDLNGKPYRPAEFIFYCSDIKYKVYRVYQGSGRKKIIERNLTEKQARKLAQSFQASEKSMVCYTKQ
jgi:hypothetical protein